MAMLWKGRILKIGTKDEFKQSDDPMIRQFVFGESEGPLRTREA
jgi:phospholipid/cholesterol/gamma-HCH transport system ATP-binding protein